MAKMFFDTEFLEGTQKEFFGKTKPTIDLISIGMVDEYGRQYYAISKDFNLKEAWNRHDIVTDDVGRETKVYWIRENVLKSIYKELLRKEQYARTYYWNLVEPFSYKTLKNLIKWNGKSNADIANDICAFIYGDDCGGSGMSAIEMAMKYEMNDKTKEPAFYAYFGAYDWVVFAWLFGKMINLPKGFPMYCHDLKSMMDQKGLTKEWKRKNCPEPEDAHNALSDAIWNLKLYNLIKDL